MTTLITHRQCPVILYGLKNGGLGCLELTRDEPVILWQIEGFQTNGSGVCNLRGTKLDAEDPSEEVIVGRDDGSIEIYSYELKSAVATLRFEI